MGVETALMLALGAGAGMLGASASASKPPKVEMPATPAPTSREPGAQVRVGNKAEIDDSTSPEYNLFQEKRTSGRSLGGLGRGGLGL